MKLGIGHLCNYARYLLGRRPCVRYTPLSLFVAACSTCNLQCPFCSYGLGADHKGTRLDSAMLSSARFREILDHRLCRHLVTIGFTGGEPMLNPALMDMVAEAARRVLKTTVSTNGILIDRCLDRMVASGLDVLHVSIDATDAAEYLSLRGVDAFPHVVDNLRALAALRRTRGPQGRACPLVCVSFRIDTANYVRMPDMLAFAESLHADKVLFQNTYTHGTPYPPSSMLTDALGDVVERIGRLKTSYRGPLVVEWPALVCGDLRVRRCRDPRRVLFVDEAGNVGACCYIYPDPRNGNLWHDPDAWSGGVHARIRKSMGNPATELDPRCVACPRRGGAGFESERQAMRLIRRLVCGAR